MIWTICFLIQENKICLAKKKRGHGIDKWNGTGGKPLEGESLENTARRETQKEIGVTIRDLNKVAEIEFKDLSTRSSNFATVFISTFWIGKPVETYEMRPKWYDFDKIPYSKMWSADRIWLPLIISGQTIKAVFEYKKDDVLKNFEIIHVNKF